MAVSNLEKNELIKKLNKISELYANAVSIKRKMDTYVPEDNYDRKVTVPIFPGEYPNNYERERLKNSIDHSVEDAVLKISKAYDDFYLPKKPDNPQIADFKYTVDADTEKKISKIKRNMRIAAGVGIFFLLRLILGTAEGAVVTIAIITILSSALFVFFKMKLKNEKAIVESKKEEALSEYNRIKEETLNKHKELLNTYEQKCEKHKEQRTSFLKEYEIWRNVFLESKAEETKICNRLEADKVAAVAKIKDDELTPILKILAEVNDIISMDYLPVIDTITDLIVSGRADDIKEAINLYEDILYKERQLQLEREKEAHRQHEEELRRQEEERRYQEDMKFRQQQERQRQREAEQKRNDEERRYLEEKRERESKEMQEKELLRKQKLDDARKQREEENKLWDAAKAQCRACANVGHCNMSVHNKTPNCTGFRPR